MSTTRTIKTPTAVTAALLLPTMFGAQPLSADAAACAHLAAALKLPDANITATHAVAAGQFAVQAGAAASREYADLPAFCRVELTLTPSPDSNITSEVWLPQSGWNG